MAPDIEPTFRQALSSVTARFGGFGLIEIRGAEAPDFLHRVSTNDLRHIAPGELVWTLLTTDKGRLVDVLAVGRRGDSLLLACSEGNEETVISWLEGYVVTEDLRLSKITSQFARAWLTGSDLNSAVALVSGMQLPPDRAALVEGERTFCLASPDRWGGVGLLAWGRGEELLGKRMREAGVTVLSEEDWETWRVSCGVPRLRHEIDTLFNPYEVGLRDAISHSKGCYVGQEVIARLDTYQKVRRGLVGIVSGEPLSSRLRQDLVTDNGGTGILTSASPMPVVGSYLGLGVMTLDHARPGTRLRIGPAGHNVTGRTVGLPMDVRAL